jgi:hypothetical protein
MGKLKDTLIDEIMEDNIPKATSGYASISFLSNENTCSCGGTFVLVGRSQDAKTIFEVYECDLCKAKKYENKAKA